MCREKRTLILNEISLRKKALQDENFPNQELIEEFRARKDSVPTRLDIEWKQPQINRFVVSLSLTHISAILTMILITRLTKRDDGEFLLINLIKYHFIAVGLYE